VRAVPNRASILEHHFPAIRLHLARDDVYQSAFPGPIFPEQRVHFSRIDGQRNILKRFRVSKSLGDIPQDDQRKRVGHREQVEIFYLLAGLLFGRDCVVGNVLVGIDCRTCIDIFDRLSFQHIQQQTHRLIALLLWRLIDGRGNNVALHEIDGGR
jgi:hypothetical protein